jgi:hypothetical protein
MMMAISSLSGLFSTDKSALQCCFSTVRRPMLNDTAARLELKEGTRWISLSSARNCGKRMSPDEVKKRVDNLTDRFAEARELLGDAVRYWTHTRSCGGPRDGKTVKIFFFYTLRCQIA